LPEPVDSDASFESSVISKAASITPRVSPGTRLTHISKANFPPEACDQSSSKMEAGAVSGGTVTGMGLNPRRKNPILPHPQPGMRIN
jgi:hypothetical protein